MRRHWKKLALLLAGIAIAACVLFATFSGQPEPSYQDRTLRQWVMLWTNTVSFPATDPKQEVVADALLHMGTNVFPFLTKWAIAEPPKWLKPLDFLCAKFPSLRKNSLVASAYSNTQRQSFQALRGLLILGTNAAPALPELARIAASTPKTLQREIALSYIDGILMSYPPSVLPKLLPQLDPITRSRAAKILADKQARTMRGRSWIDSGSARPQN